MAKLKALCVIALLIALTALPQPAVAHSMTITGPTPSSFSPEDGQSTSITFTPAESGYYSVWVVNCFHDLGRVTYTNVYGGLDAVTYYAETVKKLLSSVYVSAGTAKTVSWDGTASNGQKVEKGTYYFKIVPDADPASTQFRAVTVTLGSTIEPWRAYIRQARTWNGLTPYTAGGVSREPGKGVDCTGFVITALREMGYSLPQPQCDVYGIYNLWTSTYRTITSYANIKQGDLFAWCNLYNEGPWDHTTLYTYSAGTVKYMIDSSGAMNGVKEREIPSTYWQYDPNPHMYYWTAVGHGLTAWLKNAFRGVN